METIITINGKDPFDCTKDEINAAWEQLRVAYDILRRKAAMKFRPGMDVYFMSKRGNRVEGVVVRVNPKSVTVKQKDAPIQWKVSPNFLTII